MKKFLLTLIVTMLAFVGTWAQGTVTLSPNPGGTLELNLTDDAAGKTFVLSSPVLTSQQGNAQITVTFNDATTSDYVESSYSYVWGQANPARLTIRPKAVTTDPVTLSIKVKNPYGDGEDYSSAISVTVNNEQKIPATLSAPSSIRVGNTGSASVSVTGFTVGTDYTVAYSSSNTDALAIDASTGALTPVAAGNATITAVVTPTADGAASAYTAKTLTADITVAAPITATWTGSITNTTLSIGDVASQASSFPQVTWSENINNAQTLYSVISSDESVVFGQFTLQNNVPSALALAAKKVGSANVSIKADYGYNDWSTGSAVWVPITSAISEPVEITVNGLTGEVVLDPSSDIKMEVTDDDKLIAASSSWDVTGEGIGIVLSAASSNTSVATATMNQEGTQITIHPVAAGETAVTVTSTWSKAVYNPIAFTATQEATKTFTVTVTDKTVATTLSVPSTAEVAKGYSTVLDVTYAPATANGFQVSVSPQDGGVSASLSEDFKKLTIHATASPASNEYSVTVTPKTGSSASAATVNVTIVEPVNIESITLAPNPTDLLIGKTVALVPTFTPENPASKKLTWSSSDESKATVDANGVVTGVARGTAIITATSESINEADPVVETATINVKQELAPANDVQPKTIFKVGETYESQLSLADATLGSISYTSDNTEVLSVDNTGKLTALKAGTANIQVSITPTASASADNYVAWVRPLTITVVPGEFGLALTADPAKITQGTAATVNVTPAVTLNGAETTNTDYTIAYSLEGASSDITIDATTGAVTVPTTASVQQFAVVATLTPTDATNYKGATAKTAVLVSNSSAKVQISVDEDGVYTVNVPSPGAFGTQLLDDPTSGQTAPATLVGDATLAGLQTATSVKVTGLLSMQDVREINHLIGDQTSATEGYCTSLDMGGSQLTEECTTTDHDNNGWCVDFVDPNDFWSHRMHFVKKLILPQPCPSYTVLPEGMYGWVGGNTSALDDLTVTEGWTVAADNCWSPDNTRSALVHASSLSLPNSLIYIGDNAFNSVKCPVLMIPPYVEYIGAGAFSSSDPCALADVYFTGRIAPKYVDQNAFSSLQQMANNTVDNNLVTEDGRADRNILTNGGKLLCIMHYPEGCEAEYIDVTRIYSAMDRYGSEPKSYTTPFSVDWTAEQLAAINKARQECNNNAEMRSFDFTGSFDPGYNDLTMSDRVWPSQELMTAAYSLAWLGFQFDGTDMRDNQQWLDKRGLYQFVTTMGDSPKDPNKWEFEGYENNKWYTICVPFDMSPDQVKKVFGEGVQVCRFSKVIRKYEAGAEDNGIVFEFRNSVMNANALDGDGNASTGNKATYHDESQDAIIERELAARGGVSYVGMTGIVHGVPYMIKPRGDAEVSTTGTDGQLIRVFNGFKMLGEANVIEEITATDGSVYTFAGTRRSTPLVKGTYFLGRKTKTSAHRYYYYAGGEKNRTPYTAAIFAADGGEADGAAFFEMTTQAPKLVSVFGDDEGVNAIENVTIVCGDDVIDGKTYTIGGQLVNSKNLPAGLYIKNGKKFIVK